MSAARAGLVALVGARLLVHATRALPPGARAPWQRSNHAGAPVTLLEGPAAVGAASTALLAASAGPGALVVVLLPGAVGGLDDLTGDTATKGLRGHLGALRRGRVTSGSVKIAGLVTAAAVAAVLERDEGAPFARTVLDTVVVAGAANLVNLLDLRPGRALKVTTAAGVLMLGAGEGRVLAATLVGTGVGLLPEDLAGRSMLGDCGANALGGLLGLALVRGLGPRGRAAAAVTVTGLTLLSERVSFTRVIESTPVLREIDAWGRAR